MAKKTTVPPHVEDAEMDLVNVTALEHKRDIVLRRHKNGATTVLPLSWKEMGLPVKASRAAMRRLA
jgi:hypothetical protein